MSGCHSSGPAASDVILAMGADPEQARGSVRFCLGRETSREDVERAATALSRAWNSLEPGDDHGSDNPRGRRRQVVSP